MLAVVVLAGGGYLARGIVDDDASVTTTSAPQTTPVSLPSGPTPTVESDGREPVADVATAVSPAVVFIQTGNALGSGFIYDASGLILTNAHVVGEERTVTVRLADGATHQGTVLGRDPSTDVAVVRIEGAGDLPVVRLSQDDPQVGQMAVALGSPFGLEQTVTAGIVSAVDRPVPNNAGVTVNMIQTDAPINPGNSGGALANRSGEIIGINTAIFSQTGENSGIGFAIPIDVAKRIADQIAGGQTVQRAQLGIQGSRQQGTDPGAVVAVVVPNGPAAKAGIQEGDRIVKVNGEAVRSFSELSGRIGSFRPGDSVSVDVVRGSQNLTFQVVLAAA